MAPRVAFQHSLPRAAVMEGVDRDVHVGRVVFADTAVDTDHVPLQVEQWATGIAAHERAVGCDRIVGTIARLHQDAPQPQHQTAILLKSARMSQRNAPVARFDFVRVAELRKWIFAALSDLHQARVERSKHAERLALNLVAVVQRELAYLMWLPGNMCRGKN